MLRETMLVFLGVLGGLKLLYTFRGFPVIGSYLSTFVALGLVYPPVVHITLRRLPIHFFEKKREILSSLFLSVATMLVLFPPFLVLNHFYQRLVFGRGLTLSTPEISLEMVVIQLLLVAFPEEFFFRGYLQSQVARFCPGKIVAIGWAVPITSLLFAFSHTLITFQWWHFAIFFPSLVFGWLREKTGGLVAPILFHTASNLLVHWIGTAYR